MLKVSSTCLKFLVARGKRKSSLLHVAREKFPVTHDRGKSSLLHATREKVPCCARQEKKFLVARDKRKPGTRKSEIEAALLVLPWWRCCWSSASGLAATFFKAVGSAAAKCTRANELGSYETQDGRRKEDSERESQLQRRRANKRGSSTSEINLFDKNNIHRFSSRDRERRQEKQEQERGDRHSERGRQKGEKKRETAAAEMGNLMANSRAKDGGFWVLSVSGEGPAEEHHQTWVR